MARRNWTDEEVDYIKEHIGHVKIPTIAKNLNRTETSVLVKMKRLGLSNTKTFSGQLTMHELATHLKIDAKSVKLWMDLHGLPYMKRATRTTRKFYFIDPTDFWQWAFNNKKRIDFSKIERQSIIPEPMWVEKERQKKHDTTYKPWTTKEITFMLKLRKDGQTLYEIGESLNRSPISIERKLQRVTEEEMVIVK